MKKLAVLALATCIALAIAGCGGSAQQSGSSSSAASSSGSASAAASASASSSASASASASTAVEKFDGSAFADTGDGEMILYTPGGNTEGGNVPQVAIGKNIVVTQIGIDYTGGDGSVCTVYVDGVENTKMNASQRIQSTLTLQGEAIDEGVHTVEMVDMDGDAPRIYKSAQYEIVK